MAKSSCIPAAWSLMSELDRQLDLCEPEREAWREALGARKSCFRAGRGLGEPASVIGGRGPQGSWGVQRQSAADGQHKAWRCHRETSGGHWQSAPVAKCFLARAGWFLQNERGLCLRTQGWFQLALLGSVPPETWNMDRLPYTGPSVRSAIANQISTTELAQKCYFSSLCRCLHRFL